MTKHGTILLVTGDTELASLACKAFADVGAVNPLQKISDFAEAVKYLSGSGLYADRKRFPLPFLILADLAESGEDGFALLRWLHDRPGLRKRFVVIVLNSPGAEQDIQLAYELGAQSCLAKPVGDEQFTAAVRRLKEYWIDLNLPPGDFQ